MDFTLSDDQELLVRSARTMLTQECTGPLVRAVADDPRAADGLEAHLAEWRGLADGPLVDLCLFLEEAGAVLVPGPFFATTALFAPLARATSGEEGFEGTGTVAMAGLDGQWVVSDDPVRTFVLEADRVDRVATVVPGPAVVVTGPLPARQVATLDLTRRVFELEVPEGERRPIDAAALAGVVQRATVALAAEMVGNARWMLEATLAYARDRVQFDKPIGSFQALQHKLADMALVMERARAAVYYAAMCLDAADPDRHRAVSVAKAAAGEASRRCAKDGIQIHGGIGYTWEHDLHLHIRRAYASEALLGTTAWHHDRIADLILA